MGKRFELLAISAVTLTALFVGAGASPQPSATTASQPSPELSLILSEKLTLKAVLIPAGKFEMGSPATEKGRVFTETQHEVTISKPFYMGATHVTVDQFAEFVKDSSYKTDAEKQGKSDGSEIKDGNLVWSEGVAGRSWRNPTFQQKGDHPVVQVSWNDARAFCDWLSKRSGRQVGLPTEAQWEYACRAGTKTVCPWGDDPGGGKEWVNGLDQSIRKLLPNAPADWSFFVWDDGFVFTSPVAHFKPNSFGLYDMNGNVQQWCLDFFRVFDEKAATDPTGPATGVTRIFRGGSWNGGPAFSRSASRAGDGPSSRSDYLGFRVAVNVETR